MLDVVPLVFLSLTLAISLFFAYNYKNLFLLLFSGITSLLLGFSVWNGGIVQQTGSLITGNLTGTSISVNQTFTYTAINVGFAQKYLAIVFALFGLFLFLQAIGGFSNGGKFE